MTTKIGQNADITKASPTDAPPESASIHEGKFPDAKAVDIVHAAEEEFTEEQYRKLVRKVDLILLPLMWVSSQRVIKLCLQLARSTYYSLYGMCTDKASVILRSLRVFNMPTKHPSLRSQHLALHKILT